MERYKLASEYRDGSGKNCSRKLRREGKIPAVIYGHKEEPINLSVNEAEFKRIFSSHGESVVFDLSIIGKVKKKCNALVRDVQFHPATGNILHIDFQRINLDEKVRVEIPIVLKGNARGVKEAGGILEHGLRAANINCIPTAIPDVFEVDISHLEIGKSVHIGDIVKDYPEIEFLDPEDSVLAIVVPPVVEVKAEEEEVPEEAPAEPELISKEKKEEEQEEQKEKEKSSD